MQIPRLNYDKPENIDIVVTNASGATITLGHAVSYTTTANSADGVQVVSPATSNLRSFAGIALENIPNTAVGKVRVYGYVASIHVYATGTSGTTALGEALGPGVAGSLGVNSTGLKHDFGPVLTFEAIGAAINSPGGYVKGFVRTLG
jgi:hypothetical protein